MTPSNQLQSSRQDIEGNTQALSPHRRRFATFVMVAFATGIALCGCGRNSPSAKPTAIRSGKPDPLAIVLAPHSGDGRLDDEIRRCQDRIRSSRNPGVFIEQLGWLFVGKARESFDAGFYTLAEQCALELESRQSGSPEAMLLRGHALHSQHRFHQAEALAQQLVANRGLGFDYGLLGDILLDVGRVEEAARAYQRMLDLKPDPQGYARAAHIRWLTGDIEGALEVMRMAVGGTSSGDPESSAWMLTQFGRYLWQANQVAEAGNALRAALVFQTNYAPALLLRGRLELADRKAEEAVQSFRQAAQINPLPEYQWALSEALRASGRAVEAQAVAAQIISLGPASDPRSCAVYLATLGECIPLAERLAREELLTRADVFTHDAMAWVLAASGKIAEAQTHLRLALSQNTQDARLFFHAAVIAAHSGRMDEAQAILPKALALQAQLLPSELDQLQATEAMISPKPAGGASTKSASP